MYRLTLQEPSKYHSKIVKKFYYYGYRKTSIFPQDNSSYWSSNVEIKKLIKMDEGDLKKKILGIYIHMSHALNKEIFLHSRFDVKNY